MLSAGRLAEKELMPTEAQVFRFFLHINLRRRIGPDQHYRKARGASMTLEKGLTAMGDLRLYFFGYRFAIDALRSHQDLFAEVSMLRKNL